MPLETAPLLSPQKLPPANSWDILSELDSLRALAQESVFSWEFGDGFIAAREAGEMTTGVFSFCPRGDLKL